MLAGGLVDVAVAAHRVGTIIVAELRISAGVAEFGTLGDTVAAHAEHGKGLAVDTGAAAVLAIDDDFGTAAALRIRLLADEIAAAASLLQGQAAEGQPVVVVRGLTWTAPDASIADLVRPPEEDLFL